MIFERSKDMPIQPVPGSETEVIVTGNLRMSTAEFVACNDSRWRPFEVSPALVTKTGRVLAEREVGQFSKDLSRVNPQAGLPPEIREHLENAKTRTSKAPGDKAPPPGPAQ